MRVRNTTGGTATNVNFSETLEANTALVSGVNTYTQFVSSYGNACHRALANYAKLNRDRLEPGAAA